MSDYNEVDSEVEAPQDPETTQGVVADLIRSAKDYVDGVLSPEREQATRHYKAEPYGNEEAGRSQIVSSDLRNVILGLLPSVLRIFTGPGGTVEYESIDPEGDAFAKMATKYVEHVFWQENKGFLKVHSALKDSWIKRLAVGKIWWQDEQVDKEYDVEGITPEALQMLLQDKTKVVSEIEQEEPEEGGGFSAHVTCKKYGCIKFDTLPPEEFLFGRRVRDIDKAPLLGHRRNYSASEAVAMGFDRDFIDEHATIDNDLDYNAEELARNPLNTTLGREEETEDPSSKKVTIVEAYVRLDLNDDGIAELRKFYTVGASYELAWPNGDSTPSEEDYVDPLEGEIVDDHPFVVTTMDPEPHAVLGLSFDDYVASDQKVKTNVVRATLDSLNLTLHPRTVVVPGLVNMKDAMNPEIGALIRSRSLDGIREFTHSFVGKEALPVLDYFDANIEAKTGNAKNGNGLDADALQSTTKTAVAGQLTATQERKELIARIFAETFFAPAFTKMLILLVRHQNQARMVKLGGEFMAVNPAEWPEMLVRVKVGVGGGLREEKAQVLMMIKQDHDMIVDKFGPANPLVGLDNVYTVRAHLLELEGLRPEDFYKPIDENAAKAMAQQAANAPPAPDPNMVVAQAEVKALEAKSQLEQAKMQLEMQKTQWEQQFEMEKLRQTTYLAVEELNAKYGAQIDAKKLEAEIEAAKIVADQRLEHEKAAAKVVLEAHKAESKAALDVEVAKMKAALEAHKNELMAEVAKHKDRTVNVKVQR